MSQNRIIFDVGHPAQVHHFKNTYWELDKRGWEVLMVAKDKEVTLELLEKYGITFRVLGKNRSGILNKVAGIVKEVFYFYRIVKDFNPDVIVSRFSIHSAVVAKLIGVPNIGFADTEHVNFSDSLTVPLMDVKLTADSYQKELGEKHYRYPGNIEFAYLHPNRFTPDESILDKLGVSPGEKFVLMRFVSWEAHHDVGHSGMSFENRKKAVGKFSEYAKVFISSEKELPEEFKKYKIKIPPEKMHDALYYSSLYIGEGATMASESVMLNTPAIYINELTAGYIENEEESGLLYRTTDADQAIEHGLRTLRKAGEYDEKYQSFISDKIDVTSFMVWFIDNYPASVEKMDSNLDLRERFS